jgi:putative FmdB family regulatory protein
MPLFEYQCRDCGRGFEAFVTAERQPACPGCGGSSLARLLSSPGMVGAASVKRQDSGPPAGGCGMGGDSCACRARASN